MAVWQIFIATRLSDRTSHRFHYWSRRFHFTGLHMLQLTSQPAASLDCAMKWSSAITRCNEVFFQHVQQRLDSFAIS